MRANKLFKRQKAEKGSGRTVKIKHLLLPKELVEDLKLYKDCYEFCFSTKKDEDGNTIPIRVTYEQMLRRWMENIGRIDPDVAKTFREIKKSQQEGQERLASDPCLTTEQLTANEEAFDPTSPVNEPWNLKYFFVKDGERLEALPCAYSPFCAQLDGRYKDTSALLADGWTLQNEIGDKLDFEEAHKIRVLIKEHLEK